MLISLLIQLKSQSKINKRLLENLFHVNFTSIMEGLEVRELIQKWREISAQLEEKQQEAENFRRDLSSIKLKHTNAIQKWEEEKMHIQCTITQILNEVSSKQTELQHMEKEMIEIQHKIGERQQRNKEYSLIISGKRSKVELAIKDAEKKDVGPKEVYEDFVRNREAIKKKLQLAIREKNEKLNVSTNSHLHFTTDVKKKISNVIRNKNTETSVWVKDLETRCWSAQSHLHQSLLKEATTSASKKELWAGILSDLHNLSSDSSLNSLNSCHALLQT